MSKKKKKPASGTGSNSQKNKTTKQQPAAEQPKRRFSLFSLVSGVAIVALLCLAVSIIRPGFFQRVFKSSPLQRGAVVMRIGEYEVTSEEYIFVAMQTKQLDIQIYGDEYWVTYPSRDREAIAEIEEFFINKYARLTLAKEMGIVMTDEDRAAVDAQVDLLRTNYDTEQEWHAALANICATDALYREMCYQDWILGKFNSLVYSAESPLKLDITDEDRAAAIEEYQLVGVKQIAVLGSEDASADAKKKALIDDIYERLQNGEDFDELMYAYGENENLNGKPAPFTVRAEELLEEFSEQILALEIGEYSKVFEFYQPYTDQMGYSIVMRIEPDAANVEEAVISMRVEQRLAATRDALNIRYSFGYKGISMSQVVFTPPEEALPSETITPLPIEDGTGIDDAETDADGHDHSEDGDGADLAAG